MKVATRVHAEPAPVAAFAPDYWDCFAISSPGGVHRPSRWARLALGGAQVANGAFAQLVWHRLMGFELSAADAPGTVAGWRATYDSAELLVLDADGPRNEGRMVFASVDGGVQWTTMLSHRTPQARRTWSVLGHAHRSLAPLCLTQARLRLGR